ncbi:ABC transporter [Vulcanibacillus modesticaldus]|uniref:ABC transporter n=1 Tax=Vulcanibacillus modesticaldus TaxID=337097 RepID=A0A1D2YXC9_9BACI|nr:FtsX-like permease family protein [Vulcanibacillus modesticaldus]OEG00362.1 ABC transporter [Vulcanibacillus modesticaldus]
MIKSIKGLSLRFFQANKFIAWSSIISVMLSISLIITMSVFAVNAKQSLINEMKKMYGDMDLSVGYNLNQNKIIDKSLLNQITSQENIQQFSGVLVTRFKVNKLNADVYTVGVESDSLAKSKYHFNQDIDEHEVSLNNSLAEALNVQTGDRLLIEDKPFMVKEVLADLGATGLAPDILILSRETVQKHIYEKTGINNEVTYILIKAKENTDILSLANHIRQIDPDIRIDVTEEDEYLKSNLDSLNIFMIVLSFLILIVTSLLIISNFETFLYKYRNQFAIMRSLGATTEQMFKVVLLQSSLINIVGAVLGFLLSLVSHKFLLKWFEKLFSFESSVLEFNYAIAIVVMLISMLIIEMFMFIPSFRSAKVLPLKIIRENEQNDFYHKKLGKKLGKVLLISGFFFIIYGKIFATSGNNEALPLLIAAFLLIFGIFRLFPIYLSPILTRLLPILRFLFGNVSYVAVKNVIPQVRKNTFIVLTISTMMIIAVFGSALFKTNEKNEERYLKIQYPTDIVVTSRVGANSTINPFEIQKTIKDMTTVKGASTLSRTAVAELKKGNNYVSFNYAMGDLKEMEKQGLLPTLPKKVDNIIIVTKNFADRHQLKVGDTIELGLYLDSAQKIIPSGTVIVANIVEKLPGSYYDAYMDWKNTTYRTDHTFFNKVFVSSDDPKTTLQELAELKTRYPAQLQFNSYEQSLEQSKQMFFQRWSIFIVVIVVMLLSIMLGVFNTLINNINSKRKELAILRTISVSKKGIIQVILTQVILYILIGLILGITGGVLFTYFLSLMDPGVNFDYTFISVIVTAMLGLAFVIFIPFANKLGKTNISLELTQDNK